MVTKQDKAEIINFLLREWLVQENKAYAEILSRRNRYIARLEERLSRFAVLNLQLQERVDELERQLTIDLTSDGEERPRVRRRLEFTESDTETDSEYEFDPLIREMFG